jgi:predicted secreted protein
MTRIAAVVTVLALALATPAMAQSAPPLAGTMLTLTAHAEKTLPRDQLQAELRVEAAGDNPVQVQAEVNRTMTAALAHAKAAVGVRAETTGYSVYQERDAKGNPTRWHGNQGLRLASNDFPALLRLVGTLQAEGLVISDLGAELSPAVVKAAEDQLTDEALKEIRARATRIAATLGAHIDRYTEFRVGNVSMPPVPVRFMATAAAPGTIPPPVAAAGDATLSVTVSATVLLAPVR